VGVRLKGEGSQNSFSFLVALPLYNNISSANYTKWEGDLRVAPSALMPVALPLHDHQKVSVMQVALPLHEPSESFTIPCGSATKW